MQAINRCPRKLRRHSQISRQPNQQLKAMLRNVLAQLVVLNHTWLNHSIMLEIKKEQAMAVRKPMIGPKPERSELDRKIMEALKSPLTDEQFEKQKASFAYGNAPDSDYITKDSVMKAIHSFRLKEAA